MRPKIQLFRAALMLLFFCLPLSVFASWPESFEPQATRTLADGARLMVVPVGPTSQAASEALTAVLRQAKGVELVMDSAPLGDVSALGDEQIYKAAATYPLDGVVIVRVFPSQGETEVAVLAYGAPTGALRRTVSVMSTAKLDVSKIVTRDAEVSVVGVPLEVDMSKVENAAKASALDTDLKASAIAATEARSLKRGEYQRKKVTFGPDSWEAYLGVFKEPIEGGELYRAIGQDQLADEYDSGAALKTTGYIGSGIVTALGVGLLFVGVPVGDDTLTYVGVGAAALGVAGLITTIFYDPQPAEEAAVRKLAEEHNRRLSSKLGVSNP